MKAFVLALGLLIGSYAHAEIEVTTTICWRLKEHFHYKITQAVIAQERFFNAENICKNRSARCAERLERNYLRALSNVEDSRQQYEDVCR